MLTARARAHHVLGGRKVLDGAGGELGVLCNVVADAVGVRRAEIIHRHLRQHAAHVALEPPVGMQLGFRGSGFGYGLRASSAVTVTAEGVL